MKLLQRSNGGKVIDATIKGSTGKVREHDKK